MTTTPIQDLGMADLYAALVAQGYDPDLGRQLIALTELIRLPSFSLRG